MKKSFILATLLLTSTTLLAENIETKWYGGASYLKSNIDTGITNTTGSANLDEKDKGYKLTLGYRFSKYISAQAEYTDFGEAKLTGNTGDTFIYQGTTYVFLTNNGELKQEAKSFGISGLFYYPVHKYIEPFAKVGIHRTSEKMTFSSPSTVLSTTDENKIGLDYGIGVDIPLTKNIVIRTSYEVNKLETNNVTALTAGLIYRF